ASFFTLVACIATLAAANRLRRLLRVRECARDESRGLADHAEHGVFAIHFLLHHAAGRILLAEPNGSHGCAQDAAVVRLDADAIQHAEGRVAGEATFRVAVVDRGIEAGRDTEQRSRVERTQIAA